jgi:hypothetical protein
MASFYLGTGLVNYVCFPAEIDHHGSYPEHSGDFITELNLIPWAHGLGGNQDYVISGFTLPAAGGGPTNIVIGAGAAVVAGYYIKGTSTTTVSFADVGASFTRQHIFLKVLKSGTAFSTPAIEVIGTDTATQPTKPADSILLGIFEVNSSGVTTRKYDRSDGTGNTVAPKMAWGYFNEYVKVAGSQNWASSSEYGVSIVATILDVVNYGLVINVSPDTDFRQAFHFSGQSYFELSHDSGAASFICFWS